jgi:hypothetical protein
MEHKDAARVLKIDARESISSPSEGRVSDENLPAQIP